MNDQLYSILENLIVKNNIKVNKKELKFQLVSHPSYPSLHAVTGVLDHLSIPNLALRLSVSQEMLSHLPNCFIANIATEKGEELVLVERRKGTIKIVFDTTKSETISQDFFLKKWNGIIVAIEKDEQVENYEANSLTKIAQYGLYVLGVFFLAYFYYSSSNGFMQSHFALSLFGLIVSVIVVKHELGLQSQSAHKFCNLSSKTSCDAVLESGGALLFNKFKLSDVSIVTFFSYSIGWFAFLVLRIHDFNILALVSVLAFPVIIYSIYYQYNIVRKWCPLCLGIVAILILQIGASLFFNDTKTLLNLDVQQVSALVISTIFSIGIWAIIRPLLIEKKELTTLKIEHYKFKRDFSVFKSLYHQNDSLKMQNYFPNELVFGDKNAPIELVLVTSPLCHFCKTAHKDIESLLRKLNGKIKVIIRFNVNTSKKESTLYKIATKLLNIYEINGEQSALKALDEVYADEVNLDKWLINQPKIYNKSYDYTLDEQNKWSLQNGINFTPALYVNNVLFPKEYNRTDLIFFIDELIEILQPIKTIETKKALAS